MKYIISESEILQQHDSDQRIARLLQKKLVALVLKMKTTCLSQNYNGKIFTTEKNCYKWSELPPNARVRTPQHNIINRVCASELTAQDEKDLLSIWNKLFDCNKF